MRDPACKRGPASIGTSESDPRPVCAARRLPMARLLTEVLRYMYMKWIQNKGQKAALISTLQYNFSNFGAIAVQFWCILSYIRLLKQSKKFLGNGRLGWGGAPPLNTPLVCPDSVIPSVTVTVEPTAVCDPSGPDVATVLDTAKENCA